MNKNYDYLPHELAHLSFLKENAFECALFLKREDDSFPLSEPTNITLIGNGVRHTVIGGTGSGAVNVRYEENVESAFLNEGFTISSTDWLNHYDEHYKNRKKEFIKQIKKEAKEKKQIAASYGMGKIPNETDYEFTIFGDHEIAIYVLSRNAGEGSDRQLIKGDIYLSDTEIRDILLLNRTYKKFLLVLNTPGVIDLSPVLDVKNILLISQLGSLTGNVLVDIILGKKNPAGKLTDTWANISDYPYINTPIKEDDAEYKEGSYVGYRYFSSKNISPLFPFGFGLSYSKFNYQLIEYSLNKDEVTLKVKVTNLGPLPGKEVIQVYISAPKARPLVELVAFKKSQLLDNKESEELEIKFKLSDFPIYDETKEAYLLEEGNYIVKIGNSSINLYPVFSLHLKEEVIIKQVKNVFDKPPFNDLVILKEEAINNLKVIELDRKDFPYQKVEYLDRYQEDIPPFIKGLSVDQLILLSLGDYKTGITGAIGQSCSTVLGGAGETTLRIEGLNETINMVDGPAGLRLVREYIVNKRGAFISSPESISMLLDDYLPFPLNHLVSYRRNLHKKGSKVIQIATAIPIATALAQSFNYDFIKECGRLVREEMEIYGVDVWLAPGMNIHRHILCGRNFEYYSEDPLLTSVCASAITDAIQENPTKSVTVKHFACNNQETNRMKNNSLISEKAIREIYLFAFEKVIRNSGPRSIMTSYNLINNYHASEHHGLIVDILRSEWGYKGLIMTDWVATEKEDSKTNIKRNAAASRNLKNGNNICMPGNKKDIKDIKNALKANYLTKEDLEISSSIVYNFISKIKGIKNN